MRNYKNEILEIAVRYRDYDLVKALIEEHGADIPNMYSSALPIAVRNNDVLMVKYLLDIGANIDAENGKAIRLAANNNNADILQMFLDYRDRESGVFFILR